MKIEMKRVDDEKGIIQITTTDERWYYKEKNDIFVPSVTWIASFYPKGVAFYKWLANKGWDEAEALKIAAGDKGSKVHQAICDLIDNKEIKIDSKYINHSIEMLEELSVEEYECVISFADWFKETNPTILNREFVVFNDEMGYTGTVDLLCKIGDKLCLIDIKTSPNIWPEQELQVSAYKHALKDINTIAILQVGYKRNKKLFKFTEIEDCFDVFLATKQVWKKETEGIVPLQKDYPLSIKL